MGEDYGAWTFESTVTAPDGIKAAVCITVPVRSLWNASGSRADAEAAMPPIAQTAAAEAMKQINEAKNEVPF